MNRILVIRGGAIGDFVLTLPAIKLLRDRFPTAHIELLANEKVAVLAENRFYADAIRSIESGPLAGFFALDSILSPDWAEYFAGFDLTISYLFDPKKVFETNLKRAGTRLFIAGPSKLDDSEHAALQLVRPLASLGLSLSDPAAQLFPSETDRAFAISSTGDRRSNTVVLHPGSGSETKNWPIENWAELGEFLLSAGRNLLVVSGEADERRARLLESAWSGKPVQFAKNLALPEMAALLGGSFFIGHDSGISHIAAAVGARCLLLFGRTDPAIWAPANKNVTVLRAPEGKMHLLDVAAVLRALERLGQGASVTS